MRGRGDHDNNVQGFLWGAAQDYIQLFLGSCSSQAECDVTRLLQAAEPDGGPECCWNWTQEHLRIHSAMESRGADYNGHGPPKPNYFGSYALDGLAVALWAVYHSSSATDAIITCANLLGDADSTACVAGQLAGAYFGASTASGVDPRLCAMLRRWDPEREIEMRAVLLAVAGIPR